jgi:hypothetical protein
MYTTEPLLDQGILRQIGRKIANWLARAYGEKLGFALLVFRFGDDGKSSDYISNADRQDMIKALRETADRLENPPTIQ